jgi:hypothetical protein
MNKEELRMSFLAGLITEGEYKQNPTDKILQEKIDSLLYNYVDDINNARGISVDDLPQLSTDLFNLIKPIN